jgi:hypothetical protein
MFMYMLYRTVVVVLGGVTTVRLISSTFCTEYRHPSRTLRPLSPGSPAFLSPTRGRFEAAARKDSGGRGEARACRARERDVGGTVGERAFSFRTRPSSYPILSQPWLLRTVSAGPAPLTPGGHCVLQEAEAACELKVVLGKKCSEKHE